MNRFRTIFGLSLSEIFWNATREREKTYSHVVVVNICDSIYIWSFFLFCFVCDEKQPTIYIEYTIEIIWDSHFFLHTHSFVWLYPKFHNIVISIVYVPSVDEWYIDTQIYRASQVNEYWESREREMKKNRNIIMLNVYETRKAIYSFEMDI